MMSSPFLTLGSTKMNTQYFQLLDWNGVRFAANLNS